MGSVGSCSDSDGSSSDGSCSDSDGSSSFSDGSSSDGSSSGSVVSELSFSDISGSVSSKLRSVSEKSSVVSSSDYLYLLHGHGLLTLLLYHLLPLLLSCLSVFQESFIRRIATLNEDSSGCFHMPQSVYYCDH